VLYRRFYSATGDVTNLQLVVPYEFRSEFLKLAHEGITGGHLGRSRTRAQVKRRAYWPGWTEDFRQFLRCCEPCARFHRGPPPHQSTMKPMMVGEPFERVSIDITGPHPRSSKGNVFILTLVCHWSKWSEAIPIRNHTATTVARALMVHVFSRLGMPLQLLSDRGPEFESELFAELCQWMEIDKMRTTAYRAATNGMVERYHGTLNSILGKIVSEDQKDWCEKVPIAAAAYRASAHEATGYSPNLLMLGREVYAPLDIVLGHPPGERDAYDSTDEFVVRRQRQMREVYAVVREQLQVAATRRKRNYDIRAKDAAFKEGDWVWYYYPRRYLRKSPKWQRTYIGPYLLTRLLPPSNAVLQKSRRSQPFVVHLDKLKLLHGDTPLDWRLSATQTSGDAVVQEAEIHQQPAAQVPAREDPSDAAVQDETSIASSRPRSTRTRRRPARRQDPEHSPVGTSGDPCVGEEDLQQKPGVVTFRDEGSCDAPAGDETDSESLRRRSSRNRKRPARLRDFVVSHRPIQVC